MFRAALTVMATVFLSGCAIAQPWHYGGGRYRSPPPGYYGGGGGGGGYRGGCG